MITPLSSFLECGSRGREEVVEEPAKETEVENHGPDEGNGKVDEGPTPSTNPAPGTVPGSGPLRSGRIGGPVHESAAGTRVRGFLLDRLTQRSVGTRVRDFLLGILEPPDRSEADIFSKLTKAEKVKMLTDEQEVRRQKANINSLDEMVRLNEKRIKWAQRMQDHAESCCEQVWILSHISFALGWLIIVLPILLFCFSTPRDPTLLWFSGAGIVATVAILVAQPIDRVQKATSDMAQMTIILNSWVTEVGLIMHHLDTTQEKDCREIADTANLISKTTLRHVRWIQLYTEKKEKEPEGKEDKKPKDKEGEGAPV